MKRKAILRKEKESNTGKIVIVSIMALLMIFMVAGISVSNSGGSQRENQAGHSFVLSPQTQNWVTTINGEQKEFFYLPEDVQTIPTQVSRADLEGQNIVLAYNGSNKTDQQLQAVDYARFIVSEDLNDPIFGIVNGTGQTGQQMVYDSSQCEAIPAIIFTIGQNTSITKEQNCIYAQTNSTEYGQQK